MIEQPDFTGEELATIRDLANDEAGALGNMSDEEEGVMEQAEVVESIIAKIDAAFANA